MNYEVFHARLNQGPIASLTTQVVCDNVTWGTEIYPDLLCDGVISIRLALTSVRYIEHLFLNRSLSAQL